MGHNLDLIWLLGFPETVDCPICSHKVSRTFEEYDIDCGEPQAKNGVMTFNDYCKNCDNEFIIKVKLNIEINTKR